MQLCIPSIGNKLRLLEPWSFQIQNEYRNSKFWEATFSEKCPPSMLRGKPTKANPYGAYIDNDVFRPVTLPEGTVLTVDRIYIRKGAKDFDSITFWLGKTNNPFKTSGRFWVKLADANQIQCEVVG